jgi:hypothetical protein
VLVGVSLLLRSSFIGIIEFKGDEATALALTAKQLTGALAETGLVSSVGIFNPPFFIYLLSIPGIFTLDPLVITMSVIVANSLGLIGLFFILRKRCSVETALAAVALLASAPWPIFFARKIWAQDLLFPFIVLVYGLLLSYVEEPSAWKIAALAASLSVLTQLHMSGAFFLLAVALFILLFHIRIGWRRYALGIGLFILLYSPFLWYHVRTGFSDLARLQSPPAHGLESLKRSLQYSFDTITGLGLSYLIGGGGEKAFWEWSHGSPALIVFKLYAGLAAVSLLASLLFAVRTLMKRWHREEVKPAEIVLALLPLTYIVAQSAYAFLGAVYPHYQIILYPSLAVLTALFLERIALRRWLLLLSRAVILLIVCTQFAYTFALFRFIDTHHETLDGDYGTPYRFQR